ncbi:MAG: DNA recombination protein RmuC [Betaproteobacteria bacterium]|nr:DNA recombination protein RmuC [Betaproteobacteria bacterium]
MNATVLDLILLAAAIVTLLLVWRQQVTLRRLESRQDEAARTLASSLGDRHLSMLRDTNDALNSLGDRLVANTAERSDALRGTVEQQLQQTRDALVALQMSSHRSLAEMRQSQTDALSEHRDAQRRALGELRTELLEKSLAALGQQAQSQSESLRTSVQSLTQQLTATLETLTRSFDGRMGEIQGKVNERLDEGFRRTNETFANVMARLATIDEAQRKIDGLTTNVVSLQELLGDKRSRGAFGEVQLEHLVRNALPASAFEFQYTLPGNTRADCVLRLPEPTGLVAIDAKFPLENYHRMFDEALTEPERKEAQKAFRADVRKHVDDIASRYILEGVTSDGAVMFVPAEAVFAEIHAHHGEVVDHALRRRVWIVSPTTMMAVLNTARAVLKDVETRHQVHVIQDELGKLGREFGRFEDRMRKLASHIRQANEDVTDVHRTSEKIVRRFQEIERVELDAPARAGETMLSPVAMPPGGEAH